MKNEEEEIEQYQVAGSVAAPPGVATFFVFTDLPRHIEFRAPDMSLLETGTVVHFDLMIKSSKDPRKTRHIDGPYILKSRILRYGGKRSGLTQYLEWEKSQLYNLYVSPRLTGIYLHVRPLLHCLMSLDSPCVNCIKILSTIVLKTQET